MAGHDEQHLNNIDRALETRILALLSQRDPGKTICVSEAARAVFGDSLERDDSSDEGWRDLMDPAREAARRLVAAGEVVITQGGKIVDPATARGPIRVRLRR